MLYLVEGLNCCGKTTWINSNNVSSWAGLIIKTSWANPLRWIEEYKISLELDSYLYGTYETIYKMCEPNRGFIYWDRTFISAYVYGSLSEESFDALLKVYKRNRCCVQFIDTPVEECVKRYEERSKTDKRVYVDETLDWNVIRDRFLSVFDHMQSAGFEVITRKDLI